MKDMKKSRTSHESAKSVGNAVRKINSILSAISYLKNYSCFNYKKFKTHEYGKMISDVCKDYDVDEKHIRSVGDFSKDINLERKIEE